MKKGADEEDFIYRLISQIEQKASAIKTMKNERSIERNVQSINSYLKELKEYLQGMQIDRLPELEKTSGAVSTSTPAIINMRYSKRKKGEKDFA